MNRALKAIAASGVALALLLGGCSGGGGDKPSKEEVRAGLLKQVGGEESGELYKKVTECMADEIYDSVSVGALRAIVDGDKSYKGTKEDEKALKEASEACSKKLIGG
ncbi:MAG: hypothetical protein Q4B08_05950 [Propionibacteriaceae bacterium]|nr:hypothetical protein [Propionibacteriaceae bacterium]